MDGISFRWNLELCCDINRAFKSLPTPTKHEDNGGRKASHRLRRQNPSQTRQSKQTQTQTQTHCFFFWVKCLILIIIDLSDGRGDPEREDVDEPILRDSAGGGSKNQRGWHGL